jgi:hypothetical protein
MTKESPRNGHLCRARNCSGLFHIYFYNALVSFSSKHQAVFVAPVARVASVAV